ncbi:MAG TPA: hypothetical protein VFM79_05990 [Pelobium sp.]|nr:hypothetical protein [Pelobium sp.]
MKSEDENMELQKEAPNLAAINKQNTFKTPDGYFESLNEQIVNQVNIIDALDHQNEFDVPAGYFENLEQQVQSAIYLEDIKAQNTVTKDFDVPVGYFADAEKRIKNSITTKPKKSNIIQLYFVRYAAAACILLTTSLGVYINIKHSTSVDYQLSKIPAKEIEIYLNQHTDASDLPMLMESIDEDANLDLDDFELENTIK